MWQRFNEDARRVVFLAQEEAQKFGEGYVSTEHLLLSLTRDPGYTAARALRKLDISPERIRAEIEKKLPRGDQRPPQDMTMTPRVKRVFDLALDEARLNGQNTIGTEHLLVGIIREGDGLAGRVLAKLEVELDEVRLAIRELQASGKDDPAFLGPGRRKRAREVWPELDDDASQGFRSLWQRLTGRELLSEGQVESEFTRREARGFTMWLRFSERARRVVFFADEAAQAFGEGYLSTEHLLLGLLREPDNVAARVLQKRDLNLSRLRDELEAQLPILGPHACHDITMTPRAMRAIDLAYEQARDLDQTYIGTGHLLLGLIAEELGVAGRLLAKRGMELGTTRLEVKELQGEE